MKTIPVETKTIDAESGEVISEGMTPFALLPPRADKCQVCADNHPPEWPHNSTSLYYQYAFYGTTSRWPTWADASAHCSPEIVEALRKVLADKGIKWTAPPDDAAPIAHWGPANEQA